MNRISYKITGYKTITYKEWEFDKDIGKWVEVEKTKEEPIYENVVEELTAAEEKQITGVDKRTYGQKVSDFFREAGWTQDEVEATINNYLLDPTNEEYIAEFNAMQQCRAECKERAKNLSE